MNNYRDIELIFERYKDVQQSTSRTPRLAKVIKEQYGLNNESSTRLAIIFEQAVDQKQINDIVEYLLKPAPEGGGMTPEQVAQFGQELSKQDPNQVESWLQQTYPDVFNAMQKLKQTSASEQEEYFAEGYSNENFFIEQSWNKTVIQFLSENVSPKSLSWRKMLYEAANIFNNSNSILLEFSYSGTPNQYSGAPAAAPASTGPGDVNDFVSKIQQVIQSHGQSAPPDVIKNIQSILNKVSQGQANTAAAGNIKPGTAGTHTTNKGETRNVQIVSVNPNGSVQVQALDEGGKPKGAPYAIQASNFTPSGGAAGNTSLSIPGQAGASNQIMPSGQKKLPPALPQSPSQGSQQLPATTPDKSNIVDAEFTEIPNTPDGGGAAGGGGAPAKQGFFSKLKGALGKGWNWVKNNKWKSLLYAGGLAALAGIAIVGGPAAAGLAIANAATSMGTKIAAGAGGVAGGMQAYKQSGAEGKTGLARIGATAKGALKGAAKGALGGIAGGLIGQGINTVANAVAGSPSADIGAPEVRRTSPGETPEQLVARGHEPLGDKGLDKFETQTGTEFDKVSVADQGIVQTGQELNQQFPGFDASSAFENEYDNDVREVLGLGKGGSAGAKAKEVFQSFLTNLQQTNPAQANEIAGMKTGAGTFKKLLTQWLQSGGASQINSSYEYKGDSDLLWEAYQRIVRR